MTTGEQVYDYEFAVWPHESGHEPSLFALFRMYPIVMMEFTEKAFGEFRASIERQGFTLRECVRRPTRDPEPV